MNKEERLTYMREYQRKRRLLTNHECDRQYRLRHPETLQKYRAEHKKEQKESNDRRIKFKGKYVLLPKRIKKDVCTDCGKSVKKGDIPYTVMHHTQYDPEHPEKYTVELCSRCHRKRHIMQYSMTEAAIKQREYRAKKTKVTDGISKENKDE